MGNCINDAASADIQEVGLHQVIQHFEKESGLPQQLLRDDILFDKDQMERWFSNTIIGQPEAVAQLCSLIKIFKTGLNNPHRPIATLLFAGPTGVGKTACAQALADYFFKMGQTHTPLVRIDMSEFQYPSQIDRFIGSDTGEGQLTKEIRERPFSVLLLDEIEKANPAVFDVLLSLLDEGVMVDAFGRVTSFRNAIVIMTSNIGASAHGNLQLGKKDDDRQRFYSAIASFFKPEFFNRIDHIVVFDKLSQEAIRAIAEIELNRIREREGIRKRKLTLQFSDGLFDFIASNGFNEKYGARPLQRLIDQRIIAPLAHWLIAHPEVNNAQLVLDYEEEFLVREV